MAWLTSMKVRLMKMKNLNNKNDKDLFVEYYKSYISQIKAKKDEDRLKQIFYDSLYYHLSSFGKMLRPLIMVSVNSDLGEDFDKIKDYALALELIHNYSLIHDDLPAMDNDDYRRGRLTIHKKYSEDIAILAGDYLLTEAFNISSNSDIRAKNPLSCINYMAQKSNDSGMLGGQIVDLNSNAIDNINDLLRMYEEKTSALFQIAFVIPALASNKDDKFIDSLEELAKEFGLLFQILDDIDDRDEDLQNKKVTIFNFASLDQIEEIIKRSKDKINFLLDDLKLENTRDLLGDFL